MNDQQKLRSDEEKQGRKMPNLTNFTHVNNESSANIAVLMTCHSRKNITLKCLKSLHDQRHVNLSNVFLVDDGSSDGTGIAVKSMSSDINVIEGDGSLFWNGGMRLAWESAKASGREFDFYLWLNDDVELLPGALEMLVTDADSTSARGGAVIVTAATIDPDSGRTTYGGHCRPDPQHRPLRMILQEPQGTPKSIDTFSGNITLVSREAYKILGNLCAVYEHIYGDLDYGFRASAAYIPMVLASHVGGVCAANQVTGTSLDQTLSRSSRLRKRWIEDSRVHARDWSRFVTLHGGGRVLAMLHRASAYVRILLNRPHDAA